MILLNQLARRRPLGVAPAADCRANEAIQPTVVDACSDRDLHFLGLPSALVQPETGLRAGISVPRLAC